MHEALDKALKALEDGIRPIVIRHASAPRLILRADGSYEDRGDFLRMIGSAWHLVVPDGDVMIKQWNDAQERPLPSWRRWFPNQEST